MRITAFPTSSDIYLEVDGTRVAVVQSYTAKASKSSTAIEAFGEAEPVATVPGQARHVVELTRLYATDEAIREAARHTNACLAEQNLLRSGTGSVEIENSLGSADILALSNALLTNTQEAENG